MVEQVADRDGFAVGGEFGEEIGEVVVVVQLAVVDEQHDAGRCELLGEGCEAEICGGVDGVEGAEIGDAVSAAKDGLALRTTSTAAPGAVVDLSATKMASIWVEETCEDAPIGKQLAAARSAIASRYLKGGPRMF